MYSRVYVEITNICNMNCSFCHGHKRPPKQMSLAEFNHILNSLNGKRIAIEAKHNKGKVKSSDVFLSDGKVHYIVKYTNTFGGESKDGKKIIVNNLSKWLFGVPGARGNLTVTRAGGYIQLPGNTPEDTVELIKTILMEKAKEGPSKD